MANNAKGSGAKLFFAEEDTFGKPDWTYGAAEWSVGADAQKGQNTVVLNVTGTGLSKDDYVAFYTGDFDGVVQLAKLDADAVDADGQATLTLVDNLTFKLRQGDHARKVDNFKVSRIRSVRGMVTAGLALELGEIANEALRASAGQRVRGASRPGSIAGDGGSIVVQPGTQGFAQLLRHAVGSAVYYNNVQGVPVSNPATTTVRTASEADASSLPVADESGFAAGDIVRVGPNSDGNYDYVAVSALVATSGSEALTLETTLAFDHAAGEAVVEVTGTQVDQTGGYEAGATEVKVDSKTGFAVGDKIRIGNGDTAELVTITSTATSMGLTFSNHPLRNSHGDGSVVLKVEDGVIIHELRKGNLPEGMTVYQYHPEVGLCYVITGVKVSSMAVAGDNTDATIKATFSTSSKAVVLLSSLPFDDSGIVQDHTPYTNLEIALFRKGSRLIGINSATMNLDNELETNREMGSPVASAIEAGTGTVTCDYSYQFNTPDRFKEIVEGISADYGVRILWDDKDARGEGLEFQFPQSVVTGNAVAAIDSPNTLNPDASLRTGVHPVKKVDFICFVRSQDGPLN